MSALEQPVYIGECGLHGWHGKVVCPRCREEGQVALEVLCRPQAGKPRRYRTVYVNESLLVFRGGGREKARQENRCRMCLRPRGPESTREWRLLEAQNAVPVGSRPLTRHHLLPLGWFKNQPPATRALRSVDANIIPLCRQCHDEVEVDEEARRMLRRVVGGDEAAFVIQLATPNWFNSRYPR